MSGHRADQLGKPPGELVPAGARDGAAAPVRVTYRDAGVDIDAGQEAVERIKSHVRSTLGDVAGNPLGHFGGVYPLAAGADQLLVASADGAGTKLKLAFVLGGDAHASVGGDLVRHCVNDLLACGARPLFFLDYLAMAQVNPATVERVVSGIAAACRENALALIGGETAEMPDMYAAGEYDLAGFIVGTVAPDRFIDGDQVQAGDALVGLPSEGLHTNGYSLAHRIVGLTGDAPTDRELLAERLPGTEVTLGQALLAPHRSYLSAVMPLMEKGLVRGIAHITGGGLIDNVPRMIPAALRAEIDTGCWRPAPIFEYLTDRGSTPVHERYRVFNMGIGLVLAIAPENLPTALANLSEARVIGRVVPRAADQSPVLLQGRNRD